MTFASLCLFALLSANSAFAQEQQAQKPAAAPAVDPNPNITARPTIIFPFDDPKDPLAAERVYLPHAKFVELWNAAHPELKKPTPAPWHGQVTEALFVVSPKERPKGDESALAEVRGRITFFAGQPMWVPIPLKNGVLTETKLDDQPAATMVLDVEGESRVAVYLANVGMHVLDLSAQLPIQQAGPAGQLTLQLAPVPAGKLLFVNSGEEIAFRVNGATNTFRVRHGSPATKPNEAPGEVSTPASEQRSNAASLLHRTIHGQGAKETYYEIAINAGGDVRLAWQPKQVAGAVDAIVQSDSTMAVQVEDSGVRINSGWQFKVPRGTINDVSFSLPKELKVRSISGPDVGGWELGENVDGRVLRVFLRRAVGDQTSLEFELFLETHIADEPVAITLPTFAPLMVSRDFGLVGLFAAPQFALKNVATKGLTQINAQGSGIRGQGAGGTELPLSAYRYTARPFEVSFSAQRRAPESTGLAEHALVVERRKVRMSSRLRWELAGALRSSVGIQLPPMWLPVDVDATALQDWHIDPETNVLTIEFTEPRIGAVEVILQGNVPKEPEDEIAEVSAPTPLELSKLLTQAAVWFDPAYQATISSSNTWKTSDPEHCSEELRNKLSRPAKFVFTSNVLTPEVLAFDLARAVPKLSADAVSLVTVSDTAVDYSLALQWKISEAAADTFTFTTPDWLAGKLDFQGSGIRQTSFVPAGGESNRTRWTVTLQDPVGSRYFLLATATLPPPAEKREVTAPTITFERHSSGPGDAAAPAADGQEASPFLPLDTQRQYVVVINISGSQLAPVGEIGEAVPRDELPIVVDPRLVDQATAVLRVRGSGAGNQETAVAPKWSLKSYAAQAGASASVNLADLTTVLAADGTWRMQCVYTIKNRSRQFLALQLPEKSQALSVFVAKQPSRLVELKKAGKTYQLVALPKTSEADLSFEVRLILSGRLATGALPPGLKFWSQEIELPTPSVVSLSDDKEYGIPVARTLWAVHVPKDWSAKPLNDPAKNNLTEQAADTAAVAYQSAWLQEANDLMRVVEGSNYRSSQRMEARNNLKQIGMAIQNYHEYFGQSGQPQSEEGRKLAESVRDFQSKQQDLERRIVIDNVDGTSNFYVAKDQQQAAHANTLQGQAGQNGNVDLFFDQLNSNGESFQRKVVTDNNTNLFLFNSAGGLANNEDRNGNGVLDPGEDLNGDGILNLGDGRAPIPGADVDFTSPDLGLKFKLNIAQDQKPASGKPTSSRSAGQNVATKAGTEVDRANRRKQAVDQLEELNKSVVNEKLAQQQLETANQQPQNRASTINAPAQPNAADFQSLTDRIEEQTTNQSGIIQRRRGSYGNAFGGQQGSGRFAGGGQGGGGRGTGRPQNSFGVGVNSNSGVVGSITLDMSGSMINGSADEFAPGSVDTEYYAVESMGWTQAGGLSLPIAIQLDGNVLRFSRASGSPRLALSVRPNESDKLGLGLVWGVIWASIAFWLLRLIAGSSNGCAWRQATAGLSALGLLGMFFLPSPLSQLCFVAFALSAIVLAIGVLRNRRKNVAA